MIIRRKACLFDGIGEDNISAETVAKLIWGSLTTIDMKLNQEEDTGPPNQGTRTYINYLDPKWTRI